jgi:hypothetical protein
MIDHHADGRPTASSQLTAPGRLFALAPTGGNDEWRGRGSFQPAISKKARPVDVWMPDIRPWLLTWDFDR